MGVDILSIGTAVPRHQIKQDDVFDFMSNAHGLTGDAKNRLKALYRVSAIRERYSVVPDYGTTDQRAWQLYPPNNELEPFPKTKHRNEIYRKEALPLSIQAIEDCLGGHHKSEISHLITVSCTGLYAPGLDIDLVNALDLNKNVHRTCINFMGCYAAITAMKTAHQICSSDKKAKVLVVCVELCTLHFQKDNDEENLIANALFGDGAAAMLLSAHNKSTASSLTIQDFKSSIFPDGKEEMAWNIGDNGFEMKLTAYVPDLLKDNLKPLIKRLEIADVDLYAIHPGGKRILDVAENALGITKDENKASHDILKEYGNMSSPTILFVLKRMLQSLTAADEGKNLVAMAFGPGLTIETVALKIN